MSAPDGDDPTKRSRRSIMKAAATLAVAGPLALTILPGIAAAKDDHDGEDDDGPPGANRGRGRKLGLLCRPGTVNAANIENSLSLVPVSTVNGGTGGGDFTATNPGSDALAVGGAIAVSDAKQVLVMLRGAVGNAQYDVQFVRLHDGGREDLGSFTTDVNGNFNGAAPNALGGSNRAGGFVLIRGGSDEYVSSWA